MAELSKLLAFMFKEDKEDILAQYNKMLDDADDEQALLDSFGSPTKLAVTISRTYKRSERKLAVEADSKEDKPAAPEHIIVTPVKKEKPAEKPAEVNTGLSYADIIEEIRREKAAEEGVEYKPMFFNEPEQPAPEPEQTAAAEAPEEDAPETAETESEPEEAAAEEETAGEAEEEETPAEEETENGEENAEETGAEEATVVEPAEADQPEEETKAEEEAAEAGETETEPAEDSYAPELVFEELESIEIPEETTRYKTNVALLILYLIFAIPISAVLIVLALAVAAVLVALGVSLITIGVEAIGFAFAKLVIFADIMLCAGAVLIAFAVALILLWIGVLVLVRGISGIVRGAKALVRSFCVKEVSDNE